MKKEIKNILFDLGGVLFHLDYQRTIQAFQDLGFNEFKDYFTQFKQNPLFDAFETGKISSEVFISELQKELPEASSTEIINAWNAMLIGIPSHKLQLLKELGKHYRLFMLSNANEIHLDFVNQHLKEVHGISCIKPLFEKAFYSQEIGLRKPHATTFEWVLKEAGIQAEETLFIEDTIQHIEGAKSVGLHTHHLKSNEEFSPLFPGIAL
jgi:glucose-1-phosphatase